MAIEIPTMLITDDDRFLRETLSESFERRGIHTVVAANGAEALEVLVEHPAHVALVDYEMPRLNGIELIREVDTRQLNVTCILMSGRLSSTLEQEAQRYSAFSCQSKPFSLADIVSLVERAFRDRHGIENPARPR